MPFETIVAQYALKRRRSQGRNRTPRPYDYSMSPQKTPNPSTQADPTMAEVAQLAGVSVPTVSKVLNGREDVATATRARVRQAMRNAGYVHRPLTRRKRAGSIDLVIDGLDSYWAIAIVSGAEEAASHLGCSLTVLSTRHGSIVPSDWMSRISSRATDGVIVALTRTDDSVTDFLKTLDAPVVLLDPIGSIGSELPTVGASNWQGGFTATNHFIALGHRRIGLITGPLDLNCSHDRRDGYLAALSRSGIEVDHDLIVEGDFLIDGGYVAANRLFDLDKPVTAIFTSGDLTAAGLYRAAADRGIRIPFDVSVIGFDDIPICEIMSPPLTTIRQPLEEMARAAVRLIEDIATGAASVQNLQLTTPLVERSSVRTL